MSRRWLLWVPLAGFLVLLAVVAAGLWAPADRAVHSALVGRPLPAITLPPLVPGKPGLAAGAPTGKPRLVNIFASWCVPCQAEAPQLMALRQAGVRIDGVAVRDTAPAIRGFLTRNGDPFARIGDDRDGRVQLALGSSGVPETFVVDAQGVILDQHIGDIRPEDVPDLLAKLGKAR